MGEIGERRRKGWKRGERKEEKETGDDVRRMKRKGGDG